MARRARIVLPGYPHHVTQRGNRRQQTLFKDKDYALYRDLMASACACHDVRCWAWCLMPNHVHLVLEPSQPQALARAVGEAHRRYTRHVNSREGWTGLLWQGRFASCAMDEGHALAAVRYVENNPEINGDTYLFPDPEITVQKPVRVPDYLRCPDRLRPPLHHLF